MDVEVKKTCPLGHTCRKVVDGYIEECHWYTKIQGTNPQDGTPVDEKGCAITFLPLLTIEVAQQARSTSVNVQSLRNANDKRQAQAIEAVKNVQISKP